MRLTQLLLTAILIPLAPPALGAATPATAQWILSSARARGAGNPPAEYVTSLRIVNPGSREALVDLTYLPQSPLEVKDPGRSEANGDNSGARAVRLRVAAGETKAVEDVVGTLFESATPFGIGAGGIRVESDLPVSVFSRTYVANGRSADGVPGTFGISVPSSLPDEAIASLDTAYLPFVASSPDPSRGFRSNLILLNTASTVSVARVRLVRGDGTAAGEREYKLAPLAATQEGDVAKSFGIGGPEDNMTLVVTVSSGGPILAGLTPIDNALNAPNFAAASKVFAPNNGAFGLILDDGGYGFAGRLDVLNGTVDFLSATLVIEGCPQPNTVQTYLLQAFGSGSNRNTAFTTGEGGTWSFTGSSSSASWSGTILPGVDGTISGSVTYSRATGSAGGGCPGISRVYPFQGSRGQRLVTVP